MAFAVVLFQFFGIYRWSCAVGNPVSNIYILNRSKKIIKINLFYNFKIKYYKNQIFITNLNICTFKYNKSKI